MPVPTKKRKIDALKANLRNELYAGSEEFFKASVVKNQEELDNSIETIVGWMDSKKKIKWDDLYENMLPKAGVKRAKEEKWAKNSCLTIIHRLTGRQVMLSIYASDRVKMLTLLFRWQTTLQHLAARANIMM